MNYAVVKISGKQYRVKAGDVIEVDRLSVEKDGFLDLDDVLLLVSDGEVKIGTPTIPNAKVKAKVLEHKKGEKIRVAKFKAKVRYRRVMGFRSLLTSIKIEKIQEKKSN